MVQIYLCQATVIFPPYFWPLYHPQYHIGFDLKNLKLKAYSLCVFQKTNAIAANLRNIGGMKR